jgi:glycosyltransferase involved in cell wall biosynthesis
LKISIIGESLPLRDGSAPGKALYAIAEGLIAEGHDVDVTSWSLDGPSDELPSWCTWKTLRPEAAIVNRVRPLLRPRSDSTRFDWEPADASVAVADDLSSFAAVARSPRSVATFHYLIRFDASVRRFALRDVQTARAERRAYRRATLVTTYSRRVAAALGARAVFVPIAYPIPPQPVPPRGEPIAGMIADWRWPPNRAALKVLLSTWPDVRARIPTARLILAGTASDTLGLGTGDGVEVIGAVKRVEDFWAEVAVLVFPCPPSSGPKVKVIESLAFGVPVVTTADGVEGIELPTGSGAIVTPEQGFASSVAKLLDDAEQRVELGRSGRSAILAAHAPSSAAKARSAVFGTALGASS